MADKYSLKVVKDNVTEPTTIVESGSLEEIIEAVNNEESKDPHFIGVYVQKVK